VDKQGCWEDSRPEADYTRTARKGGTDFGEGSKEDGRVRFDDAAGCQIGDDDSDDQSSS